MNVPYPIFLKHAEKVTKGVSEGRPILKGVFHDEGVLYVTDAHRLYVATCDHAAEVGTVMNPKTGAVIEAGAYPDVKRILPDGDSKFGFAIDVPNTLDALKALQAAGVIPKPGKSKTKKALVTAYCRIDEGGAVTFGVEDGIIAEYYVNFIGKTAEPFEIWFNAEYVIQALALFKDIGATEVIVKLYDRVRPFILEGNGLTALIVPIRKEVT